VSGLLGLAAGTIARFREHSARLGGAFMAASASVRRALSTLWGQSTGRDGYDRRHGRRGVRGHVYQRVAVTIATTGADVDPEGYLLTVWVGGAFHQTGGAACRAINFRARESPSPRWRARSLSAGCDGTATEAATQSPLGGPRYTVSSGMTFYESQDPSCTPIVRSAGQGYGALDVGEHAHIARNESGAIAENIVIYLAPQAAALRIDAPDPGNCPF